MKKNTELLQPDTYYHIYNRGINGEPIFKQESNYPYFLSQYAKYIESVADTYAYCLLSNHFHLLVKTKSEEEILQNKKQANDKNEPVVLTKSASFHISNQFAKLFNSYTQALNKAEDRTGSLFESPFRRIEVTSDAYFTQLICYIHQNPQKHGFVNDFRDYIHSSYHSHLLSHPTKLKREEVINWFGSAALYEQFHSMSLDEKNIEKLVLDF